MYRVLKIVIVVVAALSVLVGIVAGSRYLIWKNRYRTNAELFAGANAKNSPVGERRVVFRFQDLPDKYQVAAGAVAEVLVREKHDPKEFRVRVEEREKQWVFQLWHLSAFAAEREAAAMGAGILGNPGGKCRNIVYDLESRKASGSGLWQ
jgi:hypothetical protein